MTSPIFRFESTKDVLNHLLQEKKNKNPSFSLRAWAKRLGFNNPSFLSEILNGKKKMTEQTFYRIAPSLDLTADERDFLECLCRVENTTDDRELDFLNRHLNRIRPEGDIDKREAYAEHVMNVANWYHVAVGQMVSLEDFKDDARYLSRRLGGKISPQVAEVVLREIKDWKLVKTDEKGQIVGRLDFTWPKVDPEKPLPASYVRHRRERSELFLQTIQEHKVNEFCHSQGFMCIRRSDVPAMMKAIDEFAKDYETKFECRADADELYRYDFSLYRVTHPASEGEQHAKPTPKC